jgi:hypothetical protein
VSVAERPERPEALGVVDWFVKPLDRERFLGRLRDAVPGLFAAAG